MAEKKNSREDQSTKEKVFNAAARLFARKGYYGVSMREISELSGMSKPMIYYYFGNKEGIYTALVNVGLEEMTRNLENIQVLQLPVREKLTELVKKHFRFCVKYPEFTRFFLNLHNYMEETPFLKQMHERAFDNRRKLIAMIEAGKQSGEFGPSANPKLAAEIMAGVMAHYSVRQLHSKSKILNDKLAEEIVEFLFKGLNE